jgi:hypothetical protein
MMDSRSKGMSMMVRPACSSDLNLTVLYPAGQGFPQAVSSAVKKF